MHKLILLTLLSCLYAGPVTVLAEGPSVSDLTAQLNSDDVQVCLKACEQLTAMGPHAQAAVPQLIKTLAASTDPELQRASLLALAEIGSQAKLAVPAVVKMLKSDDAKVRAYAAYAIGQIGPTASQAVPALIKLATDQDVVVRRSVFRALRKVDAPREQVRPLMIQRLKTADPAAAIAAVGTLAEEGEKAVPGLIEALGDKDAAYWACLALAEIGPEGAAAVPALGRLLDSEQPDLRLQALVALGEIGPAAKDLVLKISKVLMSDPFENVRSAAAFALGSIGQRPVAIKALTAALKSDHEFLRVASAWALLRIEERKSPAMDIAIRQVLKGVESEDPDVRDAATRALADPDIPEAAAGPAFRRALEGMNDPVQLMRIVDALASHGKRVVPMCIRSLENKRKLRKYAIQVLIKIGPDAAEAIPTLIATLDDPDAELRREAEFGLGAMGSAAKGAVPALVKRLTDSDPDVRHAACYALGKIGPAAKAALPGLHKAMSEDDGFLSVASVWASLKIDPENLTLQRQAVLVLVKALELEQLPVHVRVEMVALLGELGDVAKPAIPALKKAAEDVDPAVRQAAAQSLESIE